MAKLTTDEQALGAATSHQNKHCGRDVLGAGDAQCIACVHVCIDYVCLVVVLAVVGRTNIQGQCVATAKRKNSFPSFFLPLPHSGSEEKFGNGFVHSAMCSNLPTRSLTVHQYPFVGFAQICDRGDSQPRQSIVGICKHLRSTRTVDGGHL